MTKQAEVDELVDALKGWERLAKDEGGRKNPFDDPYGPTTDCLSSNDVVRMYELGVESRVRSHLLTCLPCLERIERFAEVREPAAARTGETAWEKIRRMLQPVIPAAPAGPFGGYRPAMLHVGTSCLIDRQGIVAPLRVEIVTRQVDGLKGMQVWCKGSIHGRVGEVRFEKGKFPWVEISGVGVSPEVREGLRSHLEVTEELEISVGASPTEPSYVGRTHVAFQRASTDDPVI